jgi:hypothetical protein
MHFPILEKVWLLLSSCYCFRSVIYLFLDVIQGLKNASLDCGGRGRSYICQFVCFLFFSLQRCNVQLFRRRSPGRWIKEGRTGEMHTTILLFGSLSTGCDTGVGGIFGSQRCQCYMERRVQGYPS